LLFFLPVLSLALLFLLAVAGNPDAQEKYFTKGWFDTAYQFGLYIIFFTPIGEWILSRRSIHRMGEEQIKRWELVRAKGKRSYTNWHIKKGLRIFLYACPFIIVGTLALYYLSGKSYDLGLLASLIITVLVFAIFIFIFISIIYATRQWASNEYEYNLSFKPQSKMSLDRRPRS
jgi:hypothetical protein